MTGQEHLFSLQQSVELYDYFQEKIKECDGKIEGILAGFVPDMSIKELSVGEYVINKKKASKNAPAFNLGSELYRLTGVDLLAVPGINHISALQLLSEIGFDMTR